MRRIDLIKKQIILLVERCDNKEMYQLLFVFQSFNIMHGYAVATLQAFEDSKTTKYRDEEISKIMKNGEYDMLFDEWLNEDI